MYVYGLLKICDLVCIWRSGLYGACHLAMAKFTGPCITGYKVARKVVYVQRRQRVSPSRGWKDVLSRQPPSCIDSTKGSATHACFSFTRMERRSKSSTALGHWLDERQCYARLGFSFTRMERRPKSSTALGHWLDERQCYALGFH